MTEEEVRWVRDNTGRFRPRPWYSQAYLDRRAEQILFDFLNELYGHIATPVPTGALSKLIERDARELNLYTNLKQEGLLGVTNFEPPQRPVVRIDRTLYENAKGINRFRFTLAHEYMHVRVHNPLYHGQVRPGARSSTARSMKRWDSNLRWTGWSGRRTMRALRC